MSRLGLARKTRSDTKAHQSNLAGRRIDQNIGRLDIFVHDATSMQVPEAFVAQ